MSTFLKATAAVLVTVVLYLVIAKRDKDISFMLTVMVCCLVVAGALQYLEPVFSFIEKLQEIACLDHNYYQILLKSVGIGLIAEIAMLICTDVGNAALGKSLQIMATTVILWMSLPIFNALIDLMINILGDV